MKKPELLCPAGNMEALRAAVNNGADAIYIGGNNFGARKFADNFNNDEIIEAINYAHLFGVKVYITVNTIIYEDEVLEFINYVKFLYLNGVDAIIMQDIGMIKLVRENIPDLEIHASTQTNNCNDEVLKLYKDLGVSRVVLARELSLDEINNLKTDIEKEVFIHGALCICYSGCCLFSSLNGGRSGNRGECAGPCRLPYTLIRNGNVLKTKGSYLLSPKELNTSSHFDKILDSNIQSLKIEGRMKSPAYVSFITKMYRELIDNGCTNSSERDLKKLFNRKFTSGHLFKNKNFDLMNIDSPNHIGVPIGEVIKCDKKIMIKLNDDLSQNDGIRFQKNGKGLIVNKLYNSKGLLINKASKGDVVYLDNKLSIKGTDVVLKTTDYLLMERLNNYPLRKIKINYLVEARLNKNIVITIDDGSHSISVSGSKSEKAINSPTTKDNIIKQLSKLGDTIFEVNIIDIKLDDNLFISLRELNELRRQLVDELILARTKINKSVSNFVIKPINNLCNNDFKINILVRNEKQLKAVLKCGVNNIYIDDYNLYLKYKNDNIFFRTNRTNYNLPEFENENLLITELGGLHKYVRNNNCITDYFLNVVNSYSADAIQSFGSSLVTLSPELSMKQLKDILKINNNIEIIVYGTLELMVMNHCLISMNDGCPLCKKNKYYLKNKYNELFPIFTRNCKTHIMHHEKLNLINYLNELKEYGLCNVRVELFDENEKEVLDIIKQIKTI